MHGYVEQDRLPSFIVGAFTAGNLNRWVDWQAVYQHPNLLVWEPTACTGCNGAITADFTWQASREEFERPLGLDLSCITRFHVCRAVEEFSPSAAQLLREDRARLSANMKWKSPCDTQTARILGRDSDFVNVAKVKSIRPDEEDRYLDADYDTIKVLKGESLQMKKVYHPRAFADAATINSERLLRVGGERLVFLSKMLDKPTAWSDCAVRPDTPENLAAVLEGDCCRPICHDRSRIGGRDECLA